MKKQCFCTFLLAGVSLTDYGLTIPSPFSSLQVTNSQITSMTAWEMKLTVGGDSANKINIAAFEGLLYQAAQSSASYANSAGIPVSFTYGWLNEYGQVEEYSTYSGWTLNYKVSTTGRYMNYVLTGYAQLAMQTSMPVLNIPAVCGYVQPSAIVEALAIATKATNYYQLDIDHNDAPTLVQHNAMTTSFNKYIRGTFSASDDYSDFPGLLTLSKSYSASRDAAGIDPRYKNLSQILNNADITPIRKFLKMSITDNTPQCSSFSYWVDEPTMSRPGTIHYKSNAGLLSSQASNVLQYGTSETNILSINGSYSGIAYNMTNMSFKTIGFDVDGSGNVIADPGRVTNSWSSSLARTYQTANIINDINALATQFSGDFTIDIAGSCKEYSVAQPVSLLVVSGNTVSPVSGIYSIISVSHTIGITFVTTLKIQRLVMSSANQVATLQGIMQNGGSTSGYNSFQKTSNVISVNKVDFGEIYPDFTQIQMV